MKENFVNIRGFKNYEIGDMGTVKSKGFDYMGLKNVRCVAYPRIMKSRLNRPNGYLYVILRKNKIPHTMPVHRLVAINLIKNPHKKPQVNHKNGIKTDNRVSNLEWMTVSENIKHRFEVLGQIPNMKNIFNRGNGCRPVSRLDINTLEILETYPSASEAGRKGGFNVTSISHCARGKYKSSGGFKWKYK